MKRIIICCDGTWMDVFDKDSAPTNIQRISELVLPSAPSRSAADASIAQVVYYDAGIGTSGSRLVAGVTGDGLDLNIQQAYKFIVDNYEPGDEIYCFGFSRGAYTVRSLVGLIAFAGIVKKQGITIVANSAGAKESYSYDASLIQQVYDAYRSSNKAMCTPHAYKTKPLGLESYSDDQIVQVEFIGVFDTVGALGIPKGTISANVAKMFDRTSHGFHNVNLSPIVRRAFHIVAMDEHRRDFVPCLWVTNGQTQSKQWWYPGDHADIGGGHGAVDNNEAPRVLSNITLNRMMIESGLDYDWEVAKHRYKMIDPDTLAAMPEFGSLLDVLIDSSAIATAASTPSTAALIAPGALKKVKAHSQFYVDDAGITAAAYWARGAVYRPLCEGRKDGEHSHVPPEAQNRTIWASDSWTRNFKSFAFFGSGKRCDKTDVALSPETKVILADSSNGYATKAAITNSLKERLFASGVSEAKFAEPSWGSVYP